MSDPIVDPVTGFEVPFAWLERSGDPLAREKIMSGRWTLLSDGRWLRRGLTTGTTAAAASKGAVISLARPVDEVEVSTPAGIRVSMPVQARDGLCMAIKDGGDHEFDITSGLQIVARAKPDKENTLLAGEGVGYIGSLGLCAPKGKPAISQSARRQILKAVEEGVFMAGIQGAEVVLSVPEGTEIAKKTLNPSLGIAGGISILGSTGFVEPWNDHLGESRAIELSLFQKVVVTTGRTGLKYSRVLFPDHKAVLMGSQLARLKLERDQESVLCGLPALILKWAWPEVLEGTGCRTVAELFLKSPDHPRIDIALEKAKEKLPWTRIVLLSREGKVLRDIR